MWNKTWLIQDLPIPRIFYPLIFRPSGPFPQDSVTEKHLAGPGHQADPHEDNREKEVLFKHTVEPRYLPPE